MGYRGGVGEANTASGTRPNRCLDDGVERWNHVVLVYVCVNVGGRVKIVLCVRVNTVSPRTPLVRRDIAETIL